MFGVDASIIYKCDGAFARVVCDANAGMSVAAREEDKRRFGENVSVGEVNM